STAQGDLDRGVAADSDADVRVDVAAGCGKACTGSGTTQTAGKVSGLRPGAERESTAKATCETAGGGCDARTSTHADNPVRATYTAAGAGRTDAEAAATSSAGATTRCDDADCSGK